MKTFMIRIIVLALLPISAMAGEFYTGAQVSVPLVASGTLGYKLGSTESAEHRPAFEVELGVGGGKLMLGTENIGKDGFSTGIKASLLRTWFEPIDLNDDLTYLGVELQAGFSNLMGSIGGYRRIEGDDDDWIATFGLGIRFK